MYIVLWCMMFLLFNSSYSDRVRIHASETKVFINILGDIILPKPLIKKSNWNIWRQHSASHGAVYFYFLHFVYLDSIIFHFIKMQKFSY